MQTKCNRWVPSLSSGQRRASMLVSARSQTDHSLASPEHSIASKSNKSLEREQTRERRKFHSDLATNSRLAADVSTASSEPAQMQAIMDHQEISAAIRTTRLQVTSKADKGVRKQMVPRGAMRLAILLLSLASCNLLAKVQCDHGQESATAENGRNSSQQQPLGDLVAIGAISILNNKDTDQQQSSASTQGRSTGRIVDLIASSGAQPGTAAHLNKLDYIVEFMRANKLTKFCDLLTSDQPEVASLRDQLNSLDKFTLFVPTNEALLLMPSSEMSAIRSRAHELRRFIGLHASAELVVPKLNLASLRDSNLAWPLGRRLQQQVANLDRAGTSSSMSLANTPLRISTAPVPAGNRTDWASSGAHNQARPLSRLELIVNGANVLAGHSYALQEPNNSSATYAIVHLIDQTLYPPPTQTLLERARLLAPKWVNYLELAQDARLNEALESISKLSTLFLPNDDAFRATPDKLLSPLDTNRTYLVHFLRSHLIEGLFFTGQLASSSNHTTAILGSLASSELEFDLKTVQSRALVLVNSIPIVKGDQMALNGVIHLIARPIFARDLLDDCKCFASTNTSSSSGRASASGSSPGEQPALSYERHWSRHRPQQPAVVDEPSSIILRSSSQPTELLSTGNELEREESQQPASSSSADVRVRAQRSETLVARNNRDFYRPSALPANLLFGSVGERDPLQVSASRNNNSRPIALLLDQPNELASKQTKQTALESPLRPFEAEHYKVVMNATLRQKIREQQLRDHQQLQLADSQISYDRNLADKLVSARHTYSPTAADKLSSANTSAWPTVQLADQSSQAVRLQRLLKFQPEDARDLSPTGSARMAPNVTANLLPAYEMAASEHQNSQQLTGKTVAPPSFSGCAFYDAECKRIMGKLVRLPARQSATLESRLRSTPFNKTDHSRQAETQLLDATFGETTERQPLTTPTTFQQQVAGANQSKQPTTTLNRLTRPRVSPLNQPLPPWSDEEHRLASQTVWRPQDGQQDLARLNLHQSYGVGFTTGLSREPASRSPTRQSAQILFVPVKIIQESMANQSSMGQPTVFVSQVQNSGAIPLRATTALPASKPMLGFQHQNFHTPTPYSVSPVTTHLPPIFGRPVKVINNSSSSYQDQQATLNPQSLQYQTLKAPSALGRQRLHQTDSRLASSQESDSSSLGGHKERKVVRIQPSPTGLIVSHGDNFSTGDISITSARLLANANLSNSGLATQASDQGSNLVRSLPGHQQETSSDFFQNRTIADIMDDSGLRIDNQQVTFMRLKQCLADAELLSLVTQTGSTLTLFMPTDQAFQRLIQQQVVLHQKERQAPSSSASSLARLTDPSTKSHLLPLVVRRGQGAPVPSEASGRLLDINDPLFAADGAVPVVDRVSLDCSSNQVRQILLDHMSARLVTPKQLQKDLIISGLSGRQLILSSVPSKKIVVVDGQPVVAATRAKNGMVYVVNKFLNLTQQVPNVVDLIASQPNLTTFLSYLTFSSLSDRLRREAGPLTILAPTNQAFEQLSTPARQLINSDPSALADILRGHIIEGAQYGKLLSMRNRLKTFNPDQNIEAKVIKPNVYLLDNQMTSMRLIGTTGNGVVNSIDRLIIPGWLRVSMNNSSALGTTERPSSDVSSSQARPRLLSGELEGSRSGSATTNGLPNISDQPIHFDQASPGSRLSSSQPTSFLLNTNGGVNNNNLLESDLSTSLRSDTIHQSPFLTAKNSTSGRLASAAEFSSFADFEPSSIHTNDLATNTSSNVQQSHKSPTSGKSRNMQLIEKLANLMQSRKFVKYLVHSGVGSSLKPDMNYVILVPTDQAIDKLPTQIINMLERDSDRLADLVNYHVLDTTFEYINTIPDGQTLNTLNEKDITFNWHRNNTVLTASGAVVMGGIQEENIALLVVDRVLYPTPGDILSIISKSPILSNFTSIVRNAHLEQQLSLAGPFTLFAPSDFAFSQLDMRDLDFLKRNKESARRFLLRHLSQPAIFTSSIALSNATMSPMLRTNLPLGNQQLVAVPTLVVSNSLGEDLSLRQRNDYFSVNDVNFSYADVAATNGVVHVIDGLL